jgi:hypothetical protein
MLQNDEGGLKSKTGGLRELEKTMLVASLVLCMTLILLSAAPAPQKTLSNRPRR